MSDTKPIDDGGLAFPATAPNGDIHGGMSLRDYFAGRALVGLLSNINWTTVRATQWALNDKCENQGKALLLSAAVEAYECADVLVAEKRRREQSQ